MDRFWLFVQYLIPVRTVDSNTSDVTEKLCQSTAAVLALAARDPIESWHTQKQLSAVNISLSNNLHESFYPSLSPPSLHENGVIYCGENKKGETLSAFFKHIRYIPKKILFIDDKWEQICEVERCMKQLGVRFIGIRFSRADKRVASFYPEIADLQWAYLPQII